MTAGGPAGAGLQQGGMVGVADIDVPGGNIRALRLRMAAQAKIWIALDKHLLVNRTMRIVANNAAFAHR